MSRITDKTIRPIRPPDETRGREPTEKREIPVPPGARVVSTFLTPPQRENNLRLKALYESLKHKSATETASQDFQAKFKGWKKRDPEKRKGRGRPDPTLDGEDEGKDEGKSE